MKIIRGSGPKKAYPGQFPSGRIGYAIGDIHGRDDLLYDLLRVIWADAFSGKFRFSGKPIVIFLGDYVDRGLYSKNVIARLSSGELDCFECHFLMGNHEQAMLGFLKDGPVNRKWLIHGGAETLYSYGVNCPNMTSATDEQIEAASKALSTALPALHLNFLENLKLKAEFGDYYFVHAGIDPTKSLEDQSPRELLWIRDRFLNYDERLPKIVVHGHTPIKAAEHVGSRICLDTGAYISGELSGARFLEGGVFFLSSKDPY